MTKKKTQTEVAISPQKDKMSTLKHVNVRMYILHSYMTIHLSFLKELK